MHRIGTAVVALALAAAFGASAAGTATAGPSSTRATCAALTTPVLRSVDPATGGTFLSTRQGLVDAAERQGFTDQRGETFRAAASARRGLVAVYRLSNSAGVQVLLRKGAEFTSARRHGFTSRGVAFWASPVALSCTRPVYRLTRHGQHEYTTNRSELAALKRQGWTTQATSFHAAPVDTSFGIAVVPDTQTEVVDVAKYGWHGLDLGTFSNRWHWLVRNRTTLDLRYMIQVGDLVNWGRTSTGAHDDAQYRVAQSGLDILAKAGIGSTLTVGNHDTDAVCDPGASCEQVTGDYTQSATVNLRVTDQFNRFFPVAAHTHDGGEFEPGKIDNSYQEFTAGGDKFLVIALELWPRQEAIDWAERVVAGHPHDNVIIDTHAYANSRGQVMAAQDGYGSTTPQHLFDDLVSKYRNIIMVTSGHVGGNPATSTSVGVHGNTIINSVNDFSSAKTPGAYSRANDNPTRLVTVDTASGRITSRYVAPYSGRSWPQYASSNRVTLVTPW